VFGTEILAKDGLIKTVRNVEWIWRPVPRLPCTQGDPCELKLAEFRSVKLNCPSDAPPCGDCEICTVDKLKASAIALTLQIEFLIVDLDFARLVQMASPETPVNQTIVEMHIPPYECCLRLLNLLSYAAQYFAHDRTRTYVNPVPMNAVFDEAEETVSVRVEERVFELGSFVLSFRTTFYWKPDRIHGSSTFCYLRLFKIISYNFYCPVDQPLCPP
jgi:hypothetical protein